jgi:dihydroorotate dehydrogenase subfamily 2
MLKYLPYSLVICGIIGILDSGYLTYEHFLNVTPPCSTGAFADCGKVLQSSYAKIFGFPLALLGLIHYSLFTILSATQIITKKRSLSFAILVLSLVGFMSSLYFVYLQLIVIKAICLFCMISALNSAILFIITQLVFSKEQKKISLKIFSYIYQKVIKYFLFKIEPEEVHTAMTSIGELMGKFKITKLCTSFFFNFHHKSLKQSVAGIIFKNPIGLSAGFDYEARLTQILPNLSFGFETVGTITNNPYAGNPRPRLGRLPLSKSLMVNKGFKNDGASITIDRLNNLKFEIPIGISIGRTNLAGLSQQQSVKDIAEAFSKFEKSSIPHSYYELNISCPNLYGNVSFYPSKNLDKLLSVIDGLKIIRPIFIKMPIDKTNKEVEEMLKVIVKHNITGVIFGNLQKNRLDPDLNQEEVKLFPVGNFSGKPTFSRSNELIAFTYKNYKDKLIIIGSGGVFSAENAYLKICLGASLVQLITGMIYMGPQLIAQINLGVLELLNKDGFTNISQAIGSKNQ